MAHNTGVQHIQEATHCVDKKRFLESTKWSSYEKKMMYNTNGYTFYINKCQRKPKGQSRMDNPETLDTLGTHDP